MRVRKLVLIGVLLAAGGYMLPLAIGFDLAAGPLGVSEDARRQAALRTYFQGHLLFDLGSYLDAADRYDVLRRDYERTGEDASEVIGLIGRCYDLAGRPEEALPLLERSLATRMRWHVCVYKAHCLARESVPSAIVWLESASLGEDERACARAAFHAQRGEPAAALPFLHRLLELRGIARQRFDAESRVVGAPEPLTRERNALASLLDPLTDLAECHLALGQDGEAWRRATMGVSVGQALHHRDGYAGPRYVEAGDVRCRVVRARVLMRWSQWDPAAAELDLAQAIADWSGYSGHARVLQAVRADLARWRPMR